MRQTPTEVNEFLSGIGMFGKWGGKDKSLE
jgi:hypothetical protein